MRFALNASAITDPDLLRLPHPKRMDIAGMLPVWEDLFAADLEPLKETMLDLDRPLEFVIKGMMQRPQFAAIVEELGYAPGNRKLRGSRGRPDQPALRLRWRLAVSDSR